MRVTKTDVRRELRLAREAMRRASKELTGKGVSARRCGRCEMFLRDAKHHISLASKYCSELKRGSTKK